MIVNFMRLGCVQAQGSIGRPGSPSRRLRPDPSMDSPARYFAGAGAGLAAPGEGVGLSLICGGWPAPGRLVIIIRCALVIAVGTRFVMGVIWIGGVAAAGGAGGGFNDA